MKRRYTLAATLITLIFTAFAAAPQPALAGNYSVATANDLVAAITSANADPAADTILLTADITLTTEVETSADYGKSGLPAITSDITIEGQGHFIVQSSLTGFRFLRVAATGTLTLYNLTLASGKATSGTTANGCGSGIACGGAIFSEGTLNLTHTMILSNSARDGGGLYVLSGTANIYDSAFSQNSGDWNAGHGGGIDNHMGNLTVRDSIFSDNLSGAGGGIYFFDGIEIIDRTTFSNNKASFAGGGLGNANGSGTVTASTFSNNSADFGGGTALLGNTQVSNSTFSGNKATYGGGGGYFEADNRSITFTNVTFSGNTAPTGGGIYTTNTNNTQSLTFRNSLIVQSGAGGNCAIVNSTLTADAADLADDATCSSFTNIASPPQNLNMGSFADNGGSTKTFTISAPSPALDSASATCSAFDQRGIPHGINMVGAVNSPRSGDCDVGAFEAGGSGNIRTLEFATAASSVDIGTVNTVQVPLQLDSTLYQADTVKAYVWISGGTAVAGVDYAPFGVQTVSIAAGSEFASVNISLLNPNATIDKTIVVSFAMQNGPGFSGPTRLGSQLTHTVTLIASDANTGDGQNYSVATADDLVAAITAANNTNGTDTIFLTSDITLTAKADTSPDYGDSGLPAVTSHIRIEGHGHSITRSAVVGTPNFRILRVAPAGILTLDNLTISGGKSSTTGFHFGGGLFSEGTVTLNNSIISGNNADYGGGLALQYGTVNIYDSTVSNNSAAGYGAGIAMLAGNTTIVDSVVSNNTSGGNGGGIYGMDYGSVTIDHSSISGNAAASGGGGIIFGGGNGSAIITNSTFSGNSARFGGGAALASSVYLSNSTFSGNSATQTGGGAYLSGYYIPMMVSHMTFVGNSAPSGGGIYITDPGGLVSISDSIAAQSTAGGNCFFGNGTPPASASNLADDASCSGFTIVSGPTLNIGSLVDNGGNTKTYAISAPSPALDSATGSCTGFDQRGVVRGINTAGAVNSPQNGDCDVGAFEAGGVVHTLQFASGESSASPGANSYPVPIMLDSSLGQGEIKAYVWVSGGTAVAGVDYAPFGVQTVNITAGNSSGSAVITLLNASLTSGKTIILSFATQNGPGFSGSASLGTRLTHTLTLNVSADNAAPTRNYFTTHTPTLTWTSVTQASRYEIQVATSDTFGGAIIYDTGSNLSFVWPETLPNDSYFWHVRACTGTAESTCGKWSTIDTFTIYAP